MNAIAERALLSKSAVARLLGVSHRSVDRMIEAGQLTTRTVAGNVRPKVVTRSIDRYLDTPEEAKSLERLLHEFRTGK